LQLVVEVAEVHVESEETVRILVKFVTLEVVVEGFDGLWDVKSCFEVLNNILIRWYWYQLINMIRVIKTLNRRNPNNQYTSDC